VRVALALAVPITAALLQGSVVPFLVIAGARPNLPLLVAASWSVAAGSREGVWWAFVGGLMADLLSGGPLGALLVGAATAVANVLYLGLVAAVGQPLSDPALRLGAALAGGAYTGVLAIATYPTLRVVRRATEKQASFGW